MKKGIAVVLVAAGLLTTGLLAQGFMSGNCGNGMNYGKMGMHNNMGMRGGNNMNGRHMNMNQNSYRFGFLNNVNLTNDQIDEISLLQNEMRGEMIKLNNAQNRGNFEKYFNEKSFDKNSMLKDRKNFSNEAFDIKAKYMEKIYNTLTPEQKKAVAENIKTYNNF